MGAGEFMEVYTVSLYVYKEINNPLKVGEQLEKEVRDLIDRNEQWSF